MPHNTIHLTLNPLLLTWGLLLVLHVVLRPIVLTPVKFGCSWVISTTRWTIWRTTATANATATSCAIASKCNPQTRCGQRGGQASHPNVPENRPYTDLALRDSLHQSNNEWESRVVRAQRNKKRLQHPGLPTGPCKKATKARSETRTVQRLHDKNSSYQLY